MPGLHRRIFAPLTRLVDFHGRSAPADFWPYMLLLVAIYLAGLVIASILFSLGMGSLVGNMYGLTLALILLAFAAVVRRLHDVDWRGAWMAAYVVMAALFVGLFFCWRCGVIHAPYGQPMPPLFRFMPLVMIFSLVMNGIGLLVFILCLLPGTPGTNRYGPDPKDGGAP